MKSIGQTRREAKGLFRLCLVNGFLDQDRVRHVMQNIIRSKRRGYMALLTHFQRMVKLKCDQHTAEVASAVPLADDLQLRLSADLERLYGPGLAIRFVNSPELIGGMRVVVGSDVYDGSIRHKLALLDKGFSNTSTNGNTGRAS